MADYIVNQPLSETYTFPTVLNFIKGNTFRFNTLTNNPLEYNEIITWTIPADCEIKITAAGGCAGEFDSTDDSYLQDPTSNAQVWLNDGTFLQGYGAIVSGTFLLKKDSVIYMNIGHGNLTNMIGGATFLAIKSNTSTKYQFRMFNELETNYSLYSQYRGINYNNILNSQAYVNPLLVAASGGYAYESELSIQYIDNSRGTMHGNINEINRIEDLYILYPDAYNNNYASRRTPPTHVFSTRLNQQCEDFYISSLNQGYTSNKESYDYDRLFTRPSFLNGFFSHEIAGMDGELYNSETFYHLNYHDYNGRYFVPGGGWLNPHKHGWEYSSYLISDEPLLAYTTSFNAGSNKTGITGGNAGPGYVNVEVLKIFQNETDTKFLISNDGQFYANIINEPDSLTFKVTPDDGIQGPLSEIDSSDDPYEGNATITHDGIGLTKKINDGIGGGY